MKIYILFYDFPHTSDNHAGMGYLARHLKAKNSNIRLIKHLPQEIKGGRFWGPIYSVLIYCYLLFCLRRGDKVFFMEYLTNHVAFQHKIAKWLRKSGKKNKFVGLIHLAGSHLMEIYGEERIIKENLIPLDKIIVFGSSLARFLKKTGYHGNIETSYHYADVTFYKPKQRSIAPAYLQVIIMGGIKRNFNDLSMIIKQLPTGITFHCCLGNGEIPKALQGLPHAKFYNYLSELQLLDLMQKSDVHLAVMDDTIGSNAVTSSMATGLIQVISNVGSIKDYCDESNSFLCTNVSDFVKVLTYLTLNPALVVQMKTKAQEKAQRLSLENFTKGFASLIE